MMSNSRYNGAKSSSEEPKIKSDILTRVRYLDILFILLAIAITARIGWIQLASQEVAINAARIHGRIFTPQRVKAHRGSILARDGSPLATSILRYQVEMDFGSEGFDSLQLYHRQSDSLSKLLAAYFGDRSSGEYQQMFREERAAHYSLVYRKDTLVHRSSGWFSRLTDRLSGEEMVSVKLYDTLRDHRRVPILPREIDYAEWQILKRYPILNWNMGITYNLEARDDRVYAQGGAAQRTIGAINDDRGNDFGIEAVYNDALSSEDGSVMRQRIARGFYGRVMGGESREAVDGNDVVTTLDVEIQNIADKALREQVEANKAIWGTTIVMEVATGDILAMVNLDRRQDGSYAELRNRAIGARAEPGSTFKLAAAMALLEVAKMPTTQIYNSENGKVARVGNADVQDSHADGYEVDLHTAFTRSMNVYFAKAIYDHFKEEPKLYTDFLKSIHLDRTVGLEAFGEQRPLLPEQGMRGVWTPHMTLVNMAYGYGVELSPIQTLTLYNAVANNGRMVAPRLVKEIRREGEVIEEFPTRVLVEKICSQPTLDTLRQFMIDVCNVGATKHFIGRFDGFRVAAKTGTAQFAQDGYSHKDGLYLGSLAAFMPAENPKYSVMTMLHVKRGVARSYYGIGVSGPVMQKVMQQLYNREIEWHKPIESIEGKSNPTKIKGGDVAAIREVVDELTAQSSKGMPTSGWAKVNYADSTGVLTTEPMIHIEGVMPNIYGMGLRDAIFLLEGIGLRVESKGVGSVWRQSVRAGKKIEQGDSVKIYLR